MFLDNVEGRPSNQSCQGIPAQSPHAVAAKFFFTVHTYVYI